MEHRAINNALTQIGRIAAARQKRDIGGLDGAVGMGTELPIHPEIMPFASQHHVIIAIKPELTGFTRDARAKRRNCRPLRGLAFFAAKTATHPAHFAGHIGVGNAQHTGHNVLNFCRMLG